MLNGWFEYYLFFCTVTTIFALFKLYVPCWKQIEKENDTSAKKIRSKPITTALVFTVMAFILAPAFLMLIFSEKHGDDFIKGFIKGHLGK